MKNKELSEKIKMLRKRKGFSQEELSEESGLSLRTIQRIENGETDPRGDTLKRLAGALDVPAHEITDWAVKDDKGFLTILNLSALSFLFFPILGILVPLIIWVSRKDKIKNINKVAGELLNFQISWTMVLFAVSFVFIYSSADKVQDEALVNVISFGGLLKVLFYVFMYLYNVIIIVINSFRVHNEKEVCYCPKISFIKKW
ncbi:MAG: helix-turn-helix domain-containing protein [Chlorobi bacterium]|nr:helix-turn-helix domain-containing protein [Chlorobiota bacterium]